MKKYSNIVDNKNERQKEFFSYFDFQFFSL